MSKEKGKMQKIARIFAKKQPKHISTLGLIIMTTNLYTTFRNGNTF